MNLSRNNDLKPVLVYKDPKEAEPFSKIVVPSSMRSPLWKYFGFPANSNEEIITKTKIVCGICRAYIAYNKNTTNLSTHLNCKHPEVLDEIKSYKRLKNEQKQIETPIKLNKSSSPSPPKRSKIAKDFDWDSDNDIESRNTVIHNTQVKRAIYKPKFQMTNEFVLIESAEPNSTLEENTVMESNEHEHENQYIACSSNNDFNIDDDRTEINPEDLDTNSIVDTNRSKDEYLTEEFLGMNEANEMLFKLNEEQTPKKIVILSKQPPKLANKISMKREKQNQCLTEEMKQIKKFLIKDLVPPSIIDGGGFKELIGFFSPDAVIPSSLEV